MGDKIYFETISSGSKQRFATTTVGTKHYLRQRGESENEFTSVLAAALKDHSDVEGRGYTVNAITGQFTISATAKAEVPTNIKATSNYTANNISWGELGYANTLTFTVNATGTSQHTDINGWVYSSSYEIYVSDANHTSINVVNGTKITLSTLVFPISISMTANASIFKGGAVVASLDESAGSSILPAAIEFPLPGTEYAASMILVVTGTLAK